MTTVDAEILLVNAESLLVQREICPRRGVGDVRLFVRRRRVCR